MSQHQRNSIFMMVIASIASIATGCAAEGPDSLLDDDGEEIVVNLLEAGYEWEDIDVRLVPLPEGVFQLSLEKKPVVTVQGDVMVSLDASRSMVGETGRDPEFRLWRTPNSVDPDQTICLIPVRYLGAGAEQFSWALVGQNAYTGLSWARANYNAADISLSFSMRSGTVSSTGGVTGSFSGCDSHIVVLSTDTLPGGVLGQSSLPSGSGSPGAYIMISPEVEGLSSANKRETVLTHELGHALGLRHSDWETGSSCWPDSPESKNGAVHIPGTVDQTEDSIMRACMEWFPDGELTVADHDALEALWPE